MPPPDYKCNTCGGVVPELWVREAFEGAHYGKLEPFTDEWRQYIYSHSKYEAGNCPGLLEVRP